MTSAPPPRPAAAPAPPPSARLLALHTLAAACMGTTLAVTAFLPFLAREQFHAANWQTTVLTSAVPVMQLFTIYWHRLYARLGATRYLLLLAVFGPLPIMSLGAAGGIEYVMTAAGLAALANGGQWPLNADLLRTLYPMASHGRVAARLHMAQVASSLVTAWAMGHWTDLDPRAFRFYFPLIGGVQLAGMLAFSRLVRALPPRAAAEIAARGPASSAVRHMLSILRSDRRFAAYEAAFMSYGVGWMICTALLPALATDRLHLDYSQYAGATTVLFQITVLAVMTPAGRVADRIGPARVASWSFLWLAVYPLGLMTVGSATGLGLVTALYGVGMAGTQIAWTIGPVALARTPGEAPHYLAIHSTMVGVRGLLMQSLGMAIYSATGSFTPALLLAAAGFAWGAWQMRRITLR